MIFKCLILSSWEHNPLSMNIYNLTVLTECFLSALFHVTTPNPTIARSQNENNLFNCKTPI